MSRGYFGIGIANGKSVENVGGLWRSAHAFGAALIFTTGFRPPAQPTDTSKAWKHVPLHEVDDLAAFAPEGCSIIGVECGRMDCVSLVTFKHPERALYV